VESEGKEADVILLAMGLAVGGGAPDVLRVWDVDAELHYGVAWYGGKDVDGPGLSLGVRHILPSGLFVFGRWGHDDLRGKDVHESGEHTDALCVLITLGTGDCTWHDTKKTKEIELRTDELLAGVGFRGAFEESALTLDVAAGLGAVHYEVEESERLVSKGVQLYDRKDSQGGWGASARVSVRLGCKVSPGVDLQGGADLGLSALEGPRDNSHTVTSLGFSLGIRFGF
jgi:hypothetical protein